MSSRKYGIDLGTKQLKIYKESEGFVINEKNAAAFNKEEEIIASGDEAYDMFEKTPEEIDVNFPIKRGVIADFSRMGLLLERHFDTFKTSKFLKNDYYMAVPTGITDVEKRAFYNILEELRVKPKNIHLVNKPIANAIGVGVDVNTPSGVMLVDIGAGTTEISIMSLGGIVVSKLLNIGGNDMDDSIISMVRKKTNVIIGRRTAEELKIHMFSATNSCHDDMTVMGRNIVSGLPAEANVKAEMIYTVCIDYINRIIESIRNILERTPPEIGRDIYNNGIFITGGLSLVKDLDKLIKKSTNLKVNVSENPSDTVALGIGRIMEDKTLRNLAYSDISPTCE